ncbi:MAG: ABC transporter substrate-binding protein [Syntrophorhabdaceae bacterium]|nr:ABC transporter substrate-binding protein [Syntrophorhabdaceae bacterium]
MKVKVTVIGMFLIAVFFPFHLFGATALEMVKANVIDVLSVLKDPKLQGEEGKKTKMQRIEVAADRLFDYVELSRRTLGVSWNKFSPEQRKEFVALYRLLLKDTYIEKIMAYRNEEINFLKEIPLSESTVEVQTSVTAKGGPAAIYYRAIKKEEGWKVYDVVIEGVSLINNYRTQFREILGNNPPETLLETLRKKVGKK